MFFHAHTSLLDADEVVAGLSCRVDYCFIGSLYRIALSCRLSCRTAIGSAVSRELRVITFPARLFVPDELCNLMVSQRERTSCRSN